MNFMKFLVFGFLALAIAQIARADDYSSRRQTRCEAQDDKGTTPLKPVSPEESYMQEVKFRGYDITTMQNEDGISYTVSVAKAGKLVVETDVVIYPDSSLKFATNSGVIQIQCQYP